MNGLTNMSLSELRQLHVEQIIKSAGPYRFFVTLTFQYLMPTDEEGISCASIFMGRLNKKLLGRRWREEGKHLEGVAILEHANIRKRSHGATANCFGFPAG